MSIRVLFYFGSPDGVIGNLLAAPLSTFYEWYATLLPGEFEPNGSDPALLNLILRVLQTGERALHPTTRAEAQLIDKLVATFYGGFCDGVDRSVLHPADESMLNRRYFEAAASTVQNACGSEAARLWSCISSGRPVGRREEEFPYESAYSMPSIGYLTREEVVLLLECIGEIVIEPLAHDDQTYWALVTVRRVLNAAQAAETGLIITVA